MTKKYRNKIYKKALEWFNKYERKGVFDFSELHNSRGICVNLSQAVYNKKNPTNLISINKFPEFKLFNELMDAETPYFIRDQYLKDEEDNFFISNSDIEIISLRETILCLLIAMTEK